MIIGCLFCFIICRKNTSIKNENIEGKQNSVKKEDDSMFNILYTDANGNISAAGKLQSNKLVQSNSVGQLQSYTEKLGLGITGEIWRPVTGQRSLNVAYPTTLLT